MPRKKRKLASRCPICDALLPNDEDLATSHVDACLGFDEYEWAGQHRVRVTSLMRNESSNAFVNAGYVVGTKGEDEDVDVDGDEELVYGKAQFTEDDIERLRNVQERHGGDENDEEDEEEEEGETDVEKIALRAQVKRLQAAAAIKCLICLEPFKDATTSIICWHVHCQDCWLRSLGAKKLCPQCQKITTARDLRRVYM